jgi:hypothetical protein
MPPHKGHSHETTDLFLFWSSLQQIMGGDGLLSFLRDSAQRFLATAGVFFGEEVDRGEK